MKNKIFHIQDLCLRTPGTNLLCKKMCAEMRIFMAKNSNYDYEETMVTLTDEDGVDRDFYIDEIYEVDGKTYCAAIPGDVENVTEYYVFRLKDLGNDDFEMEDIDDEEEYDAAADAYEEKLDARAWSRMMEQK